ncbi:MAG: hemerythrin domain-containing protein [Actinomycetota bacterium]
MAKRHAALMPLTHDHHHALAQCRRLSKAVDSERSVRTEKADGFLNFYLGRAIHHFREEEELFFPPAAARPETRDLVTRAVMEHLQIHGLVADLKQQLAGGDVEPVLLQEIADTLRAHVRFEENELFPLMERVVSSEDLDERATHRRDV